MRIPVLLVFTLAFFVSSFIPIEKKQFHEPKFNQSSSKWADSVFNALSSEERIAQLFMVAAYSNKTKAHENEIKKIISTYKIGGLIFFQGGPLRQANLTNQYQELSKVPLFISIDAEWGLAMRLDSTIQFPRQMTLGAIQNDSLIYEMGADIARQCKRLGMQINFAPVVDINNNPLNPVISIRSFGENKYNVANKALMYMKGMQDNNVLANAKHFPGHGDTDSDSHKTLPTVNSSIERLDTLELFPFKKLINEGLTSMMVAHLFVPALDTTANQASTLSKKIVTDLLKDSLKFNGLIFTDALNMKGVSKFYKPGEVDVKALLAGNDVLLFPENVPVAIEQIKEAIINGIITQEEIDIRCLKILKAKEWAGLNKSAKVDLTNLYADLNSVNSDVLNRKLVQNSLTLLNNKNNIIPLKALDTLKIASLSLGSKNINSFQKTLSKYTSIKHFGIDKNAKPEVFDGISNKLKEFNLVIIHLNNTNNSPNKDFGLTAEVKYLIKELIKEKKVIINISANPYILEKIDGLKNAEAIIMSYEDNEYSQFYSAQLIFGGIAAKGKLPISASKHFPLGMGEYTKATRLKYTIPEETGMNSFKLKKIDSIALDGVKEKVYPGCQVLIAKSGSVIYQKSFGYHTYDKKNKVDNDDLYDIASITKIAASTISLMSLVDRHEILLDNPLSEYLPYLKGTNKENINFREVLTHQSGLLDWIPYYKNTLNKDGSYKDSIYSTTPSDFFYNRVADDLYISKFYKDTITKQIIDSRLNEKGKYLYSDLGYYLVKDIIELKTKSALNIYTKNSFYAPLGLQTMCYKPLSKFELNQIVPTEYDKHFRKQLIHGDVHDPGAAMLGGVGGHAGLFSNSNDLAVIMQLFLNKGEYGGQRYVESKTVEEFTKCQYCKDNRRGIGFDKPETDSHKVNPVCDCVSYLSFGHSGFTGTLAWADPENEIVYIFLSNRVNPSSAINKLVKTGIRTKIQEVIYSAKL